MAHACFQFDESRFRIPEGYEKRSSQYRRADLIGRADGSVHLGFWISELAAGGAVEAIVCTYEKSVFVLDGEIEINRDGKAVRLGKHDYALLPIGMAHSIRSRGTAAARWVEKCGPQPKLPGEWQDSFFVKTPAWPADAEIETVKTPLSRMVGHFDKKQLPPSTRVDDFIFGFSRKTLIDQMLLGSQHFDLFIIEFAEGGQTAAHDHNFEEVYLVLDGEATFECEGKSYAMKPGTVLWTGVGTPHAFFMNRGTSCCWLEAMSPQPPVQNIGRRLGAWDRLRGAIGV